jgi:hypothetical protein
MRIYAQRPARLVLQVLADLAVLGWVVVVVFLARAAQAAILTLDLLARRVTGAGDGISRSFDAAARAASGVPIVGGDLAQALGSVTDTGDSLAASGRDLMGVISTVGLAVAVAIVVVGAVPLGVVWLALRVRWVLAARSALRAGPDLLALRALTHRPSAALAQALAAGRSGSPDPGVVPVPDPAAAWRSGDAGVVAALAAVELGALGLRLPGGEDRSLSP